MASVVDVIESKDCTDSLDGVVDAIVADATSNDDNNTGDPTEEELLMDCTTPAGDGNGIECLDDKQMDSNAIDDNVVNDNNTGDDNAIESNITGEDNAIDNDITGEDNIVDNDNTGNDNGIEDQVIDGSGVDGSGMDGSGGGDGLNADDNVIDISDGTGGQLDDNELRTAGLKTSLMLSDEKIDVLNTKINGLESELKKVYQHLLQCMDDKKKLEVKCGTLEEQLDRLMASGGSGRSPDAPQRKTPQKKAAMSGQQMAGRQQPTRAFNNAPKQRVMDRMSGGGGRPYERPIPMVMDRDPYAGYGAELMPGPYRRPVPEPMARSPYGYRMAPQPPAPPSMASAAGHDEVSQLSEMFKLPPHVDDKAHQLYDHFYGSVQAMAVCAETSVRPSVAALYLAARMANYQALTYKRIHDQLNISRNDLQSCCQEVSDLLGLGVQVSYNAMELIQQYGLPLRIPPALIKVAIQVAKTAMNERIVSAANPQVLATASLYLTSQASNVKRTLSQLAQVSRVPEESILNSYRHLRVKARQLFPHDFVLSIPILQLPQ